MAEALLAMYEAFISLFNDKKPRCSDLTGATDGYAGNWNSLPVGMDQEGRPYLEAGATPNFSNLINAGGRR